MGEVSLTITLRNVTNLKNLKSPALHDYHYEVFINTRCIESGYVRGHRRSDGWDSLIALLASERQVVETYPHPAAPSR